MINGYPGQSSIFPGDTLSLHVATSSPSFSVEIYRQGAALDLISATGWMTGYAFPEGAADVEWGWLGYNIPTGQDWKSGVYIAMLIEGDANHQEIRRPDTSTPDGRSAKALFVIKNPYPGKDSCLIYKLPLFTYYAYNALSETDSSGSLYTGARKVSFLRPGGGTGGTPWDAVFADVYDGQSPRQAFAHWDAKFIAWLEQNNYAVDYCTDLDIHENNNNFLSGYRLLLSVGHDEYWSEAMRTHVEQFIGNYGNVAFFSGNTCWWRVHLEDGNTAMSCDKMGTPAVDQWYTTRPENSITGVSYRNAGGWWDGPRESVGYKVQHAGHWVFQGTGLAEQQVFGQQDALLGYECDGCLFYSAGGFLYPSGSDGTPGNFLILGSGKLSGAWPDIKSGNLTATMGLYNRNGIAFTAATVDWARVLSAGNPHVTQITRNVLQHLTTKTLKIYGPATTTCGKNKAVEGQPVIFHVDTSGLSHVHAPRYQWSVSGANPPAVNDHPLYQVTMPAAYTPVTISVFVDDGTDCPAFGSLTIFPISPVDAALQEFLCRYRMMVQHISIAVIGIGESSGPFVDPLYDPPKGERVAITERQLSAMINESKKLTADLERWAKQLKERQGFKD